MIFAAPTSLHAKASGGRREDRNFENSTQMIHVHPLFKPEQKKRKLDYSQKYLFILYVKLYGNTINSVLDVWSLSIAMS